jgi:glucokinase
MVFLILFTKLINTLRVREIPMHREKKIDQLQRNPRAQNPLQIRHFSDNTGSPGNKKMLPAKPPGGVSGTKSPAGTMPPRPDSPIAGAPARRAMPVCASLNSSGNSILVADIGGTNCRFQLWDLDGDFHPLRLASEAFYPTADYARFDQALGTFLQSEQVSAKPPRAAAFAVAGPVKKADGALGGGRCEMTNLGWIVDAEEVRQRFGLACEVLNDFEAVGYGVPALDQKRDVLVLNDVPAEPRGPIAVLGPGTGLGQCQLFWDKSSGSYTVHPSEGAHATFAPRGWKQRALQASVEHERGHCSVERVACGSGLLRIYDFLQQAQAINGPPDGSKQRRETTPAGVSQAALEGADPVAVEALDMFLAIVGAEAGHMALRALSTGGVYIAGGIFPKIIERVKAGGVLEAFLWRASRFHDKVLKHTPLYVVLEEKVGLVGSRERAVALCQSQREGVYIAT